jgi:acetyl-CoA acetyltransferase family protein
MSRALVLDVARTPFGRYRGGLAGIRVDDLASLPIRELLRRHGDRLDPARIDDVLYGNTNGAGEENRDVARMAALLAGLPTSVPGATVNRLCASGGEAIVQAARALSLGDADLLIAGGVEGMTRAPFVVPRPEKAFADRLESASTALGWRLVNPRMPSKWTVPLGRAAEDVAVELGVTRVQMDAFALRSHRRAAAAWDAGVHEGFAFPVQLPDGTAIRRDESVRPETSVEKLRKLHSAFSEKGPVTAGNSSPLNDGAAAVILASADKAKALGAKPRAFFRAFAVAGVPPEIMGIGPVPAVRKLLAKTGLKVDEIDLYEVNEAFASQAVYCVRELGLPVDRVNVNGGAIAIGHPLGATGARQIATALHELERRKGRYAVITMCVGGGMGAAGLIELARNP